MTWQIASASRIVREELIAQALLRKRRTCGDVCARWRAGCAGGRDLRRLVQARVRRGTTPTLKLVVAKG